MTAMGEVYLFNVADPEKRTAIRLTCLRLGILCREVPPELHGRRIEELLNGTAECCEADKKETFREEMMLMHALTRETFQELLDTLRQNGQTVRLKAVVTDFNRKWTPVRLCRELSAEDAAMRSRGQQIHRHPKKKK